MTSQALGWGIHVVDTGFQRENMAACYVLEDQGEVAIIETGTKDTVPRLLAFLEAQGIALTQVRYVVVTHVHLDHAGGAGLLMQQLPNATFVVHEKGARHMVDPAKLQAGATAVYGKAEFDRTYGDLQPISSDRMLIPADDDTVMLGSRRLRFIDTPGHAKHHFCIHDDKSNGFFTGDTFGLAYQELTTERGPFIIPTTTPVQFDPDALKQSIQRILSYNPQRIFLTHFSMVEHPNVLAEVLLRRLDKYVDIARTHANDPSRLTRIMEDLMTYFLSELAAHQCTLTQDEMMNTLRVDAMLNAQGLDVWLAKETNSINAAG